MVSHQNAVFLYKSYTIRENYRNFNEDLRQCNWPEVNAIFREMCSRRRSYCRTERKPSFQGAWGFVRPPNGMHREAFSYCLPCDLGRRIKQTGCSSFLGRRSAPFWSSSITVLLLGESNPSWNTQRCAAPLLNCKRSLFILFVAAELLFQVETEDSQEMKYQLNYLE